MQTDPFARLIDHWKTDFHSAYNTWFLWEERVKNFRSIRRGIGQVVREIDAGTFGNAYRGSSLETVVSSVAEQRQIFKGADHAFLWKPKLHPDLQRVRDETSAAERRWAQEREGDATHTEIQGWLRDRNSGFATCPTASCRTTVAPSRASAPASSR